jgi:trigger factor
LLKVTTEPLERCEVLMTVEVDETQTNQLMKAAAQRISRRVQIPGFRPGKAPFALVERRVGQEMIRHEVLEDLGDKVFREALEQANLDPFATPSIEDISWQPLTMKVRIPVAPVVELGDYRALRLPIPVVEVDEAEVDEALAKLQDEQGNWEPVDRPAQFGDKVLVAARVVARGKTVIDEENSELSLDKPDDDDGGPDVVTPLIGASVNEERQFVVTYPADHPMGDLAGADATITMRVHQVLERQVYPLDDDFAQMVGDFATLAELRDRLRADISQAKQAQADRQIVDQAIQEIIAGASRIEWPLAAENEALDYWMQSLEDRMKARGLLLDDYLRTQQKTRDQIREEARPQVQEQLRLAYVVQEIARREGLTVDTTEVADFIALMTEAAGERADEVWRSLISESGMQQTARDLLVAKIRRRLLTIVKGELDDASDATATAAAPAGEEPASTPPEAGIPAEEATGSAEEDATEDVTPVTERQRRKPKAEPAAEEPGQAGD